MEDNILDINEDNTHLKIIPYYLKHGLIAVFLSIIFSMIIFFLGLEYEQRFQYVMLLSPISLMVICLHTYKKDNGNKLKGSRGFQMCLMMFVFYGVLMGLFTLLYISVVSPDFINGLKAVTVEKMKERGLEDEMIAMQMKYASFFFSPIWLFTISLLMSTIYGLVFSGITAAIMKTPNKSN